MSLSPSWSESNTSKVGGYASSTSELVQSLKGFVSGSFKISSCDRSIALPLLHGCPSLRQWIVSSWDPSTGRFSAQLVNDFLINSVGSWLQASRIHCRMVFLGGAFKFPAAVSSWIPTLPSHSSYFSVHAALNGLFQQRSGAWMYLVHPPGTMTRSIFFDCNAWPMLSSIWHSKTSKTKLNIYLFSSAFWVGLLPLLKGSTLTQLPFR